MQWEPAARAEQSGVSTQPAARADAALQARWAVQTDLGNPREPFADGELTGS